MLNGLTLLIAVIFLILPLCELGQRDHLLFVFTLPYCILIANRLDNTKINVYICILIGVLLAICIGMKPQFLMTPLLVELYCVYRVKKISVVLRPEIITCAILLSLYAITTFIYHPDYIHIITPYVLQHYYPALKQPWAELFIYPWIIYSLLPIFAYLLLDRDQKTNLADIIFISLISYICSYIAQRTSFPHHFIPVVSSAIILSALLLNHFKTYINRHLVACACLLTVSIMINIYAFMWPWLAYVIKFNMTLIYIFILASFLITLSLTQSHKLLTALLATSFFLTPLIYVCSTYQLRLVYKTDLLAPVLNYAKKIPEDKSLYFISAATYYSSPLIHYSNHRLIQRFDCFWMVNEVINNIHTYGDKAIRRSFASNPPFIVDNILTDINNQKPDYIFIDMKKSDRYQPNKPFKLLSYLLENNQFKLALSHYHFVGNIQGSKRMPFQLDVYKRI
jgi:hypothetical protein